MTADEFPIDPPPPGAEPDHSTEGRAPGTQEERPPVWDRYSVRWDWVALEYGYKCTDESLGFPLCREVGAIPSDRQPTFAHPPNEAQRKALIAEEVLEELHEEGYL